MMIKAIIPCCGFGTRVGMKPNQSKEMLKEPGWDHPLIEWSLNQCKENNIEPLVLVRKEKQDLIDYLTKNNIQYLIMEPGKEWAETVYNSKDHWNDKNILILPDTRWKPHTALKNIKQLLEFGSEVVFGIHNVDNIGKWGFVNKYGYREKPTGNIPGQAWGIIGFSKKAGTKLFKNMQTRKFYKHIKYTSFLFLDEFKDLTRGN